MAWTSIITAEELRLALGRSTYMALFDEDDSGNPTGDVATVDDFASVALVLKRASVRVLSRLPAIYTSTLPDGADANISVLLKDAALNFAVGMSFDRHPEYVDRFGWDPVRKGAYQTAMETMDLLQDAVLRIPPRDNPPADKPANVGGVVTDSPNRVFLPGSDGVPGDW